MTKENWTIEIKPKKKWLDIDLKGICKSGKTRRAA